MAQNNKTAHNNNKTAHNNNKTIIIIIPYYKWFISRELYFVNELKNSIHDF
jgi:hypothetical protein